MLHSKRGTALVEIIIGSAIIALAIIGATSSFGVYISYALANQKDIQASYLLEEGLDIMTYFRDKSWLNISGLSTTTTYYFSYNGTTWATTTTPQYVDGQFLRRVSVSDIRRDGSDDIAASGTYDPYTKQVTVTIEYPQGHATTTKSISTYLTNLYGN